MHYISQYVVQSISSQTKCETSAAALLEDGVDYATNSILWSTRNCGGLVSTSKSAFQIVPSAECILAVYKWLENVFTKPKCLRHAHGSVWPKCCWRPVNWFFRPRLSAGVGNALPPSSTCVRDSQQETDTRLKYYSKL